MKPNPIYNFVKTQLSPAERASFVADQTKSQIRKQKAKVQQHKARYASRHAEVKEANYSRHPLALPQVAPSALSDGSVYAVTEEKPHISIYELYDDRKPYLTAYHYTLTLRRADGVDAILHCYFDLAGIFREVTLTNKKDGTDIPLSGQDKLILKNYAELQSPPSFG